MLQSFVCPLGYDGIYADPLNCSKFYNCTENNATPHVITIIDFNLIIIWKTF